MNELVSAAAARVSRWTSVPDTWAAHRPEPLVSERLWACTVEGDGPRQAGRDAEGRVVLVGPAGRPPMTWGAPPDWVNVVEHAADGRAVTVHGIGRLGERRATTTFDAAGRPVATAYTGGFPDERYVYDGDGRIVAIDESAGVMELTPPPWREDPPGGRLDVTWEGRVAAGGSPRARRTRDLGAPRCPLGDRVARLRARVDRRRGGGAVRCRPGDRGRPRDEVFGLALVTEPAPAGTVKMLLFAGLQAARKRILADPDADPDAVEEYLWWLEDLEGESLVALVVLAPELDRAAQRAAAMHDPGDARRTIAQAAVPLLAVRDWSKSFTTTPDFAAYVIGEDDDAADLYASMVAGNPPDRLQARAAHWHGSPYPPTRH